MLDCDWSDERQNCWREFVIAVEAALVGKYDPGTRLCTEHPVVRQELRAFIKAVREGRIIKTGEFSYAPVRKRIENSGKG